MRRLVAVLVAVAVFLVTLLASADDAPAYTLEVDSDASDVIAYDAVAERLASDLGGKVARPSTTPTRAAITIRYRDEPRSLHVRVVHADGQALEREVKAEGDAQAVQREAVLLAGNLARDEARELLDALTKRPPPPPPEPAEPAPPVVAPPPPPVEPDKPTEEERAPIVVAFAYPVATNWNRPNVATSFTVVTIYGQTARVDVLGLGLGVIHARKSLGGFNFGTAATIAGEDTSGFTGSVGANIALGRVSGVQAATGFNLGGNGLSGVQLAAGANVATGEVSGVQAGVVNIGENVRGAQLGIVNVGRNVKGAQVGVVNIAENVDGAALGVVSIARDLLHPIAWTSNLAYTNAGVKFATKYLYSTSALGFGSHETKFRGKRPAFTFALGGHIPVVSKLDVDTEVAYSDVDLDESSKSNRALHVRALPGWSFAKHLRVFAGGGVRIPVAFDQGTMAVRPEGVAGIQF